MERPKKQNAKHNRDSPILNYQTIQLHIATPDPKGWLHLALKRSDDQKFYPSIWQVVTGKVEKRGAQPESFIQTALRELQEETGLTPERIDAIYNIPYVAAFTDYRTNTIHSAPVIGIIVDSKAVELSAEHSDHIWEPMEATTKRLDLYSHKIGAEIFQREILDMPKNPYQIPLP